MTPIRVLLADDHEVVRTGLRTLFDGHPDIEVVGDTADGAEAVRRTLELRPDVAVMDFSMPGLTGAGAAGRLRAAAPETKVLVVSAYEDHGFVSQALQAGARGYVLKRSAAEELVQALRAVAAGGVYLEPRLAAQLAEGPAAAPPDSAEALSQREHEVLRLLALGYANKEIGARLRISVKTVETYKTRGMEKLNLRSRVELVRYAFERGWLRAADREAPGTGQQMADVPSAFS
ncbi:Oxygen regulatory protein NreC [Gemmata obscuriglobus]|uniref:DNA-binding response regulator n=1 Tax=Gemmata obscuriglobus TaxID=114 RepID=A0A2Z3GWV1_9BACT|nr:response regulator transcription factor [Gemmata obscuriglobus]AWM37091.1 DNA-binding response regulator [Gemmata obscuriglobus]QEG30187.1 Oxygen regulatory protein NreC [Gemmata obscuriglobus]VTS09511.1 family transcriptional regulator : Two component transcriptional regulator, LuxR family OS=Methylobacterium oryzae CBMB20 GN=MOC_1p0123 PE=4 SV=1: Response_reg: GerE [Gemmata obscuriglobus UQM 2246]